MLNLVKCLLKVQLNDDNFFLGIVTDVEIFKCPCNTVLDGSAFYKSILIFVDKGGDCLLKSISQELGDDLN